MITRDEARMRALAFANRGKHVVEIMEAETREYDFGWVFFYQSAEFVRTRDPGKMLYGNAPIIVEKESGRTLQRGLRIPPISSSKRTGLWGLIASRLESGAGI